MAAKTIVIYRLGSLGDTVVALPCFHQIARAFPDHRRLVLTNEPVSGAAPALEEVLGASGLIAGVLTYHVGERSRSALFRLLLRLRATSARRMIYLTAARGSETVRRDIRFFRLGGIRKVIGAPLTPDLHDNRYDSVTESYEPEAERLARTLAPLGDIDLADRANWDLRLTSAERQHAAAELRPLGGRSFFVFNAGGKAKINDWGTDRWKALVQSLGEPLADFAAVGIGAGADRAKTQRILNQWPGTGLNLCERLSPRQSAAVLERARFFVGHDSGPMHLAAASGTSTLGLLGDNNPPRMWHPYGDHARVIHDMRGIGAIEVDTVREAVLAFAAART